ncbi:carbon-nitrogen hydrolase family protein [Vibrio sonorensis]|uniref:carbon-nitrogen hydrolase family protein n=1 Tax=Vibrio sonorensis TaxID=1004316 RepID=UPI0008DA2F18|nr:carbon-nitrogen hydrolase family protein [Vibrio sonorensis]
MALTIALVQFEPTAGNIELNLEKHLNAIQLAAEQGCDMVVFPELSLTGYEPEMADKLSHTDIEPIKRQLGNAASESGLLVISGMPLVNKTDKPFIGALIAKPSGEVTTYKKQYLHPGEERHFSVGKEGLVLDCGDNKIGLAVCADFCHAEHQQQAVALGAEFYVMSALISHQGYGQMQRSLQHSKHL